jgi:hypothetical protein
MPWRAAEGLPPGVRVVEHLAQKAVRQREVRIAAERRPYFGHRLIVPPPQKERPAERPMGLGVVTIARGRPVGQRAPSPGIFAGIVPAVRVIQNVRASQHRVGLRKLRIELDGPLEQRTRFFDRRRAALKDQLTAAQVVVVGFEVVRVLALHAAPLALRQRHRKGRDDLRRDFVLHGEDVGQLAVISFGP